MKKEMKLFLKDDLTFKHKFYILMDLLISNQAESRLESFLFMGIFYLQIISTFFSEQIGILKPQAAKTDKILNYIQKIARIQNLFQNNYNIFMVIKIILFIFEIIIIIHFIISCANITRNAFYSYNKFLINYYIKFFIYIAYNVIFDLCFSQFCFGSSEWNPNFASVDCSAKNNIFQIIISILFIIISLYLYIFISIYYNDSFYLSNSFYAKMCCNYDIYWGFNCLFISCLSTQVKFLTKEIFLIYNIFISNILFIYYIKHYLYYDKYINTFAGIFHILYTWTSILSIFLAYLNLNEKGIIYIITSIMICFFYSNIKNRIESQIFLETPYFKIKNKFYLLHYLRSLIDKINNINESFEDKSFLSAIIQMHDIECPNNKCLLKTKEDIYLPLTDKWYDKSKKEIEDEVFLKNLIVIIMNYFLTTHDCSVDMYLNLGLYQLKVIGNYCQAIYYYKKVSELKLSLKEYFSLIRLNIYISRTLVAKLKPSNENCVELENLDVSMYYKYEELSQNFIDEINNDVNLSLEFWNSFRTPLKEPNKKVDFNKVFELTDKIRITKNNIENMWNNLLQIYGGVNDFFQLYMEYIEQINDDDLKKRDLEALKRKNDNFGEHINLNLYSDLFSKETGIVIANGDKGSEGIIQLANNEIGNIFKYKSIDLIGKNISILMPKIFAINHSKYIERYFKLGVKKFVDKSVFKAFGKEKNNYIIKIRLALKLFPILNDNIYFIGLIVKENVDDIILLDDKFNIQGMSLKLMKILNINNKSVFQDNEIPFYVICKKFLNFYDIFLKGKKKADNLNQEEKNLKVIEEEMKDKDDKELNEENKEEKDDIHDNIEINENVELEYEIKLPQFLVDYLEKVNKNDNKIIKMLENENPSGEEINGKEEDMEDENDLLLKKEINEKSKKIGNINNKNNKNNFNTATPTPTPTPTPGNESPHKYITIISNSIELKEGEDKDNNIFTKNYSKEEQIYKNRMDQYKTLFNEGKINQLEELIDTCNKNSSSIEFKFNFTFDKYKYGQKQISYIVRCVDNKNDIRKSEEESDIDSNPRIEKYKRERNESIKPLFEFLPDERREIIELPKNFLKLSLENKKFYNLLQICKNDIIIMSKAYGNQKAQILEDENSSQSSQTGFDTGLLKKNRIEEIRKNIMSNTSKFYTLKYIKIVIWSIAILCLSFSIVYLMSFKNVNTHLKNSFMLNIYLYETTLWTSQFINIFISMRVLYQKYIIRNITDFDFYSFFRNDNEMIDENSEYFYNILYYCCSIDFGLQTYIKAYKSLSFIEMEVPKYLNEMQLNSIFWDRIKVSYTNDMNEYFIEEFGVNAEASFPLSLAQFLSNCKSFLESEVFSSITEFNLEYFNENYEKNSLLFKYITFLIIENGLDNILPNLYKKVSKIPNILTEYNSNKKLVLTLYIYFYMFLIIICFISYYFLIYSTNKSMTEGMEKITKIRLEKIEETIRRIRIFSINLKKYREKDIKSYNKDKNPLEIGNEINNNDENQDKSNEEGNKNKLKQESSLVSNNGFNIDNKKYRPLNVLKYLMYPPILILIAIYLGLISIYLESLKAIENTNQLLLVQNYIYGKLVKTISLMLKVKCYMSDCQIKNELNNTGLVDMTLIQKVINGVNLLPGVSEFYNEKFLLNACSAAINPETAKELYEACLSDSIIINANNTHNLMKLIEIYADNLKKEYEIYSNIDPNFKKIQLFNSTNFKDMEYIFIFYILSVADIFKETIVNSLNEFLSNEEKLISFLIITFGIAIFICCIIFGIILIKRLVHYICISNCIIKIIPISVIFGTQELETWIENKY